MEFDINKVYSVVNAEELPIGSKCIFASTMRTLTNRVKGDNTANLGILSRILDNSVRDRFETDQSTAYSLAYLIESPKKPEYKPFSSTERVIAAIRKHGGWVKEKTTGDLKLITSVNGSYKIYSIGTGGTYCKPHVFLECYVFVDDGSPCGELVEE